MTQKAKGHLLIGLALKNRINAIKDKAKEQYNEINDWEIVVIVLILAVVCCSSLIVYLCKKENNFSISNKKFNPVKFSQFTFSGSSRESIKSDSIRNKHTKRKSMQKMVQSISRMFLGNGRKKRR